ncbi:hypothetical protein [Salinibacter ruber]|uniref:hypothetical protein n=1 Tax=Salinibacter ruber TaxID=146919 RepID=UPI0020742C27|nr:hypothetical protein [Salinibacter ruber]
MQHTELIDQLADSVGKAKAKDALQCAAGQTGIQLAGTLGTSEAQKLLSFIAEDDESGTLTTVSANTVKTRLRAMA